MLEFRDVDFCFGGQSVFKAFSLQVRPGALAVMLGPSGVGKTTILRLAAGLIRPRSGTINNRFGRTAMVFQAPRLLPWLSALENVALVMQMAPPVQRGAAAAGWLCRVGLPVSEHHKRPGELSGGQQQRVAIARAFAVQPDLILMDEPFSALDLGSRRNLQNLTRSLTVETGCAVLFVTHDVPEAVRLADRILVISGAPGCVTADFSHMPVTEPDGIWRAAADLVRRRELGCLISGEKETCGKMHCSVPDKCEANTTEPDVCNVV